MPDEIKTRIRRIDLAGATTLLIAATLIIVLIVLPLRNQSQANIARAHDLQLQLADFDRLEQTLARSNIKLGEARQRLDDAEHRLPSQAEMAQFMQQLARVADGAGLQVDSITPRPVAEVGGYKALPVEIVGAGNFTNCYRFLQGLRKMDRLTRLDDLVLQSNPPEKSDKAAAGACSIRVIISTFMAR